MYVCLYVMYVMFVMCFCLSVCLSLRTSRRQCWPPPSTPRGTSGVWGLVPQSWAQVPRLTSKLGYPLKAKKISTAWAREIPGTQAVELPGAPWALEISGA